MADSRSVTPGAKPRKITLLEDRHHGTDELAEVHVPLKAADEGYLWQMQRMYVWLCKVGRHVSMVGRAYAAASEEIELIDSLLLPFRSHQGVHYAQIVLTDVSACFCRWRSDMSANLKVETNRTLPVVVESVRVLLRNAYTHIHSSF